MIYLVALVLLAALIRSTDSACATLAQTNANRLLNPCVDVVDYSYYVVPTLGVGGMARLASEKMNSSLLLQVSSGCQQSIARYVCSQIYLKCSTASTYIYKNDTQGVYSNIPLPFKRPCVSACTDLSTQCSSDLLLKLSSLGSVNCYGKTKYYTAIPTTVYTFDLTNNQSHCFLPAQSGYSYAQATETYLGTYQGATTPCAGLVNKFVSIPGYKINSSYTGLLRPYVAQTAINTGLSAAFNSLPVWMAEDCRLALKQYFCYQYFLKPEPVTLGQALTYSLSVFANGAYKAYETNIVTGLKAKYGTGIVTTYVNLPSYPHQDFCTSYTDKCSIFRERAQKASLTPYCSKTSDGIASFPTANQTILTKVIPLTLGGSTVNLPVQFQSKPDPTGYQSSAYSYTTSCPPDYSYNFDPDNEDVRDVSGTGCAVKCHSGFWTPGEWDYYRDTAVAMTIVSLVFAVATIGTIVYFKDWKDNYMVLIYAILSIIPSSGHLSLNTAKSFENRYCHNVITPNRIDNGPSPCSSTAVIAAYLYMVLGLMMFFISMQRLLYVRKQENVLSAPWFHAIQVCVILLPPLAPMLAAIVRNKFGFSGVSPWCSMDLIIGVYTMGFPTVVVAFFSYGMWIAATGIILIARKYAAVAKQEDEKGVELVGAGDNKDVKEKEKENEVVASAPAEEAVVLHDAGTQKLGAEEAGPASDEPTVAKQDTAVAADNIVESEVFRQMKYEIVYGSVVFFSFVLYCGFLLLKSGDFMYYDSWRESFVTYTRCVFRNWDGVAGSLNFESVCGPHSHSRAPISAVNMYQLVVFAPMLVIGPAFVGAYFFAYYRAKHTLGLHTQRELIPSVV